MRDAQDFEEEKISKINSAGLINITIEKLWQDSYQAMSNGDFLSWNRKLDAIWLILGGDVEENDISEKKITEMDKEIYNLGSLSVKTQGFEKKGQTNTLNRNKQYLLLRKKSLFLRRLQNSQGKGTAYHSHDDYDL